MESEGTKAWIAPTAEGVPFAPPPPGGLYIDYKYIRGKGWVREGLWGWCLASPPLPPLVPYPWGRLLKKNKRIKKKFPNDLGGWVGWLRSLMVYSMPSDL